MPDANSPPFDVARLERSNSAAWMTGPLSSSKLVERARSRPTTVSRLSGSRRQRSWRKLSRSCAIGSPFRAGRWPCRLRACRSAVHALGVKVDLLFASSGIETEIVDRATPIEFGSIGAVPVANAEELLAMKVLSMTDLRLQDRIDAQRLLQLTPELDLSLVREHLARIRARGYAREQDVEAKLTLVLRDVGRVAR